MNKSDIIDRVDRQLGDILERCAAMESAYSDQIEAVHPKNRESARNLVHYLALRSSDMHALQQNLSTIGLASLDRAERNVMASLLTLRDTLEQLRTGTSVNNEPVEIPLRDAHAVAQKQAILGDTPDERVVSIMVTLPAEAAVQPELVRDMLIAGMGVARINCGRDDQATWSAMIQNTRKASEETGIPCRVIMDLAGPKIRTGPLKPGPKVVHIRPRRDALGRTVSPRRIRLIPDDTVWQGTKALVLPVPGECIQLAGIGDEIRFRDTRGRKRTLEVVAKDDKGLVVECYKGAFIATGTKLRLDREQEGEKLKYRVGELPSTEQPILLRPGDTLLLDKDPIPGQPAIEDADGDIVEPAHISCRQPEVFDLVSPGERILLNDGKISGVIDSVDDTSLAMTVTKAKPTGSRLRGDRGINFPDSDIRIPPLTSTDEENLEFVVKYADAVSQSFIKRPRDVIQLQAALAAMNAGDLGLIMKIETKKGFKNLPKLLLTAMRSYPVGVMIARGDLAVEAGWERLAELQEQILWLCEAARVPVIWATQVLERTTKTGQPSRAEISDAALSQRADCVMLNKGPHVLSAIRMLDDILRRMQGHRYKNTLRMRKLKFAEE
ncbi:MAG: pyruvate kinase [Woeseiaceae bacterium]|nr:pyruvate kinase [Woeseiaceae bacterium]